MHGGRAGRKPTHRRYAKAAIAGRDEMRIWMLFVHLIFGRPAGSSHKRLYAPRGGLTLEQLVAKATRLKLAREAMEVPAGAEAHNNVQLSRKPIPSSQQSSPTSPATFHQRAR
jgi:hypothetical protein